MANTRRRAVRGLGKVSVDDLNRELRRRQKAASQLEAKRSKLMSKVAELEREISDLGADVEVHDGRRGFNWGRARGGRSTTLAQALATLLKGKTMSVTDMAAAVQKAGYKTKSPNFRVIVNAAVTRETRLFRRVGRGQYTAR